MAIPQGLLDAVQYHENWIKFAKERKEKAEPGSVFAVEPWENSVDWSAVTNAYLAVAILRLCDSLERSDMTGDDAMLKIRLLPEDIEDGD